ncbi:MAG: hypothetical protein FWG36_05450 [Oscillospiraceae bacterium]|nr:hypothetical protein [Oscillospiraceae bacterium]
MTYQGVTIKNPGTVSIDASVKIGAGTVIEQGTVLNGNTVIGENCRIGPYAVIEDCIIGNNCKIINSTLENSALRDNVRVGPYAHIRAGCRLDNGAFVGAFTELKNTELGAGSLIPHLSYVGDAEVGAHVNIGCGCITANFSGVEKHKTAIGNDAFIGCNSVMVAPVNVGAGAVVGAGSVITEDVPQDALAIARAKQSIKEDWANGREKNW